MDESHAFFPLLLAVLPIAGVVALFSREERSREISRAKYVWRALWPAVLFLGGAWGLWQSPWPVLAVVAILIAGAALGIFVRGMCNESWRAQRFGTPIALVLLVAGGWATKAAWAEDDRRYWVARNQRERAAAELAAAHQASVEEFARMRAKRDPERFQGGGVKEAQAGPLLAWLALQPTIDVDWAHETQRDAVRPAQRKIPLSIALLNNQFEPTPLAAIDLPGAFADETEPALWLAWITRRDGSDALVYFSGAMPPGRDELAPAERVDFTVNWNGRDQRGELLPPGDYTLHLQSAALASTREAASTALDFVIQNSGPIVRRIPDPVIESLNEKTRMQQEWQRNNEAWQRLQQWSPPPLGR